MAAPNIVSPTTITLKNTGASVGTSAATVLTCDANKAIKVSTLTFANTHGSNAADATLNLVSGGATVAICSTVSVPADATLVAVDRNSPIYLEEGDSLTASASAASAIQVVVSYEEIA
jgi:hypothetical protein